MAARASESAPDSTASGYRWHRVAPHAPSTASPRQNSHERTAPCPAAPTSSPIAVLPLRRPALFRWFSPLAGRPPRVRWPESDLSAACRRNRRNPSLRSQARQPEFRPAQHSVAIVEVPQLLEGWLSYYLRPAPFLSSINRSADPPAKVSSLPSGQRTRITSILSADPKPKWTRGSLLDW